MQATDHLGQRFESVASMLRHWNVSKHTFQKRKKEGYSLEDCLTLQSSLNMFRASDKYADIDKELLRVNVNDTEYENVKNVPEIDGKVVNGVFVYELARALGFQPKFIISYRNAGRSSRIATVTSKSIFSQMPTAFKDFCSSVNLLKGTDRFYYRNTDVFTAAFIERCNGVFKCEAAYELDGCYFRDRRTLLHYIEFKYNIKMGFDIDEHYSVDTDEMLVGVKETGEVLSFAEFINPSKKDSESDKVSKLFEDAESPYTDEEFYGYKLGICDTDRVFEQSDNSNIAETMEVTVVEEEVVENVMTLPSESDVEETSPDKEISSDKTENFSSNAESSATKEEGNSSDEKTEDDTEVVSDSSDTSQQSSASAGDKSHYFVDYDYTVYDNISAFEGVFGCTWREAYNRVCEGYNLKEAVSGGYFADKDDDGRFDFINGVNIEGTKFDSLSAFCEMVGVPCNVVLTRLRRGAATSVIDAIKMPTADRDLQSVLFKSFIEKTML